jgi:hypothetical protein
MEWNLHINYDGKPHILKAVKEYESAQIIRIRVQGRISTIMLETNFPITILSKRKAITWKIREGSFDMNGKRNARLFMDIIEGLEYYLKGGDTKESFSKYLGRTKQ